MDYMSGHVITLANSIIGVSILAMPYCFKQCGVILSVVMLLISSVISRLACHFLLKSAIMARRKTFEFLAFHIFGTLGKFAIEIGMIGFLLGTCIAFFVVMGDLGPEIVSEMTGVKVGNPLRNSILVALAVFCVLPLGLLKNVDSLNGVSKATIGFYCCLVLKIIVEALPHIFTGDWVSDVTLWRPAGILQCLPIFSMALFCQTQLFEIYQALQNASLEKMNGLIRVAVNICTWVYIFVGAFGYIAFFQKPFTGNILLSFQPSMMSDVMKIGFVLSLAFSFPLVIFPCRASLYSLLYKGPSYTILHEGSTTNFIPEGKFKMLTVLIVTVSLIIGILIPNIELVLGLVGSTIGVMICVLFPVTCFICISPRNTNERILAQIMLFVGIIVMVLGTYANLYAFEEAQLNIVTEQVKEKQDLGNFKNTLPEILLKPKEEAEKINIMDIPTTLKPIGIAKTEEQKKEEPNKVVDVPLEYKAKSEQKLGDVGVERGGVDSLVSVKPPAELTEKNENDKQGPVVEPVFPPEDESKKSNEVKENVEEKEAPVVEVQPLSDKIDKKDVSKEKDPIVELNIQIKEEEIKKDKQEPVVEPVFPHEEVVVNDEKNKPASNEENLTLNKTKSHEEVAKRKELNLSKKEVKKNDEVDIEAIKKEETELKEQEKEKARENIDQNQLLIDTIQKQNEVQKEFVEQQKKLIEVFQESVKNQEINKVNEEKLKAVKEIEHFAKKAIESVINSQDNHAPMPVEDQNKSDMGKVADKITEVVKPQINPAPLSYQLGLNQEKLLDEDKKNINNMIPLPIALAKLNNVTMDSKKINVTVKDINRNKSKESGENYKAGRDILQDEQLKRVKREADVKNAEIGKVVKEVCEEISKSTSTEKPIIKMLCKLSEPALVPVKLERLEAKTGPVLKSEQSHH